MNFCSLEPLLYLIGEEKKILILKTPSKTLENIENVEFWLLKIKNEHDLKFIIFYFSKIGKLLLKNCFRSTKTRNVEALRKSSVELYDLLKEEIIKLYDRPKKI